VKDRDSDLLNEAYKRVYMEEDNMSPEDAAEKVQDPSFSDTLIMHTTDGEEIFVSGDDTESVEQDGEGQLMFHGFNHQRDMDVELRAGDIENIKVMSDKESIRTPEFDPNNPNASLDPSNPMHRMAKMGPEEFPESKKLDKEACGQCAAMHGHDHDDDDDDENKAKVIIIRRIKGMRPEATQVSEGEGDCPPGYYWCTKSKKCKKKPQDEHDDDMRAANAQTAAMAGMPESIQKEAGSAVDQRHGAKDPDYKAKVASSKRLQGKEDLEDDELEQDDAGFEESSDRAQKAMNSFVAAVNEEEADSSLMDLRDLAQELITVHKFPKRSLELRMRKARVSFEEDEIQYVLNGEEGGRSEPSLPGKKTPWRGGMKKMDGPGFKPGKEVDYGKMKSGGKKVLGGLKKIGGMLFGKQKDHDLW